jgi:Xaa-Pro aminopeptidase
MYDIVLKANLLGIKNAKANILGATLDSIPRNYIKDN